MIASTMPLKRSNWWHSHSWLCVPAISDRQECLSHKSGVEPAAGTDLLFPRPFVAPASRRLFSLVAAAFRGGPKRPPFAIESALLCGTETHSLISSETTMAEPLSPASLADMAAFANEWALLREYVSLDRKSTRLNSSHMSISYAVFCLKK